MPQLKKLKKQMIAGSAIKTLDFFFQWHLTERCNLRCRHCYQEATHVQEMAPAVVKNEIDGATAMLKAWEDEYGITVVPSIHFTGGEPFLFEGLWDIVAYAKEQGYTVALMTNGCLITPEGAQRAAHLGIADIQVSLEGPENIHDSIHGKGSFQKAAKGVEMLAKAGNRVHANVTLSRRNVDMIETTVERSRHLGFHGIGFSRVVPCGRGMALLDDFLTAQELKAAYQRINALHSSYYDCVSRDPLAGRLADPDPPTDDLTLSGCSAGFSGVTITSDGSVMPCRRIGLVAGNLKRKSLRAIWSNSAILWRLRSKESYRGRCGRCPHWGSCRGCRAVAYAYSMAQGKRDLFADDPQCWIAEEPA